MIIYISHFPMAGDYINIVPQEHLFLPTMDVIEMKMVIYLTEQPYVSISLPSITSLVWVVAGWFFHLLYCIF